MRKASNVLEELKGLENIKDLFIVDPSYNRGIVAGIIVKIHETDIKGTDISTPYWIPVSDDGYCMTVENKPVLIRGIKPERLKRISRHDIYVDRDHEIVSEEEFQELCAWLSNEYRMRIQEDDLSILKKRVRALEAAIGLDDYGREEAVFCDRDDFQMPRRIRETIMEAYF